MRRFDPLSVAVWLFIAISLPLFWLAVWSITS